jgi:hypothetical protein
LLVWIMNKQELNKNYYQTHQEQIKARQKERYQAKKTKSQLSDYYSANSIQVLMSLKEYTELKGKRKLWLDFAWTLNTLSEQGISDIIQIQRLEQLANQLIQDYYQTASQEIKKGQNWNSLTEEQQKKLISYWGREKANQENNLLDTLERLAKEGQSYEKEIELAKFHEERGKIKCSCSDCETKKELLNQAKREQKNQTAKKEQCSECDRWVKALDEENGLCKSCLKSYQD